MNSSDWNDQFRPSRQPVIPIYSPYTHDAAIEHVISSANYWMRPEEDYEGDGLPCGMSKISAFKEAIAHVNLHHYNLSQSDVKVLRQRFFK